MNEPKDEQLVLQCLKGNEDAWIALIRRYRQLIYGVIRSYRLSDDDAADVFQSVCLDLFHNLPRLRELGALRGWLITVTSRQSLRAKKAAVHTVPDGSAFDFDSLPDERSLQTLQHLEKQQILREALDELPGRCREMVRLLFFTELPMPYAEVAERLGLAEGSIGFVRRRCLNKLKAVLQQMGF